jgi:hypothetical protein
MPQDAAWKALQFTSGSLFYSCHFCFQYEQNFERPMSLIREDMLATIMYTKMAILVHMLLRAVPFFSSIFLNRLSGIGAVRLRCSLCLLPFDHLIFGSFDLFVSLILSSFLFPTKMINTGTTKKLYNSSYLS